MNRTIAAALVALLLSQFLSGCKKSETTAPSELRNSEAAVPPSSNTVARIHWMGKKKLGIEANAYFLMRMWEFPETKRLESQTLERLSTAPWRLMANSNTPPTAMQSGGPFLLPLLNDVLEEECYFEVHQAGNQSPELAFAIHLNDHHAGLWRTNLVAALALLTGVQTMALQDDGQGWMIKRSEAPNLVELTRAGDWTLVGLAQETNSLLHGFANRIRRGERPFDASANRNWLEGELDLQRVMGAASNASRLFGNIPAVSFSVTGDGGNVLTRAEVKFPQPLSVQFEPWIIPTNLIHEPIVSFSAIRGIQKILGSLQKSNDTGASSMPNQFYSWSPDGVPTQIFCAASSTNTSNAIHALAETLLQAGNSWLAARGAGQFQRLSGSEGVILTGLPAISPFVRTGPTPDEKFISAGLSTNGETGTDTQSHLYFHPQFAELLNEMSSPTNLLYFDWELTAPRVQSWLYIGQALRVALGRVQPPLDSAGMNWLRVVMPRLANSTTTITVTRPDALTFARKSTAGLTAPELHLLVDWLESPQFPGGLSPRSSRTVTTSQASTESRQK